MTQQNNLNNELHAEQLVLTRVFNAPRSLVFKMWTEPEHLSNWWGPAGFKIYIKKFDFSAGGVFLYCMTGNGFEMWGRFVYLEIEEPEKLVFINSFSDSDGNITRAPFSATWPLEVLNTLTFEEENGKTTMTLNGGPYNASDEELQTFAGGFSSMNQGFKGTFDQLDAYIASL